MILNPTRMRATIFINADPERVWRFFTTSDEMKELLPKQTEMKVLRGGMDQVGSRWLLSTRAGSKWVDTLTEVVESQRPRLQALRSSTDMMIGTTRTSLTSQAGGTLLVMEGTAEWQPGLRTLPQRLLTALIGPSMTRRTLKQVKRLIEDAPDDT